MRLPCGRGTNFETFRVEKLSLEKGAVLEVFWAPSWLQKRGNPSKKAPEERHEKERVLEVSKKRLGATRGTRRRVQGA